MARIKTSLRVLSGQPQPVGRTPLESAYDHFRLERQGNLCSPATLQHHDNMVLPFLRRLHQERPDLRRPEELDVQLLRLYRAHLTMKLGWNFEHLRAAMVHSGPSVHDVPRSRFRRQATRHIVILCMT